jgi:hypothetical protein
MSHTLAEHKPVQLKPYELSRETLEKSSREVRDAPNYGVYLINMSAHFTVHYVAFAAQVPVGNQWNNVQWAQITPIPRTCASNDYQTCKNQQQYVLMATVNCGYNGYCLIAYADQNGNYFGAGLTPAIAADCHANSGIVYGITD